MLRIRHGRQPQWGATLRTPGKCTSWRMRMRVPSTRVSVAHVIAVIDLNCSLLRCFQACLQRPESACGTTPLRRPATLQTQRKHKIKFEKIKLWLAISEIWFSWFFCFFFFCFLIAVIFSSFLFRNFNGARPLLECWRILIRCNISSSTLALAGKQWAKQK